MGTIRRHRSRLQSSWLPQVPAEEVSALGSHWRHRRLRTPTYTGPQLPLPMLLAKQSLLMLTLRSMAACFALDIGLPCSSPSLFSSHSSLHVVAPSVASWSPEEVDGGLAAHMLIPYHESTWITTTLLHWQISSVVAASLLSNRQPRNWECRPKRCVHGGFIGNLPIAVHSACSGVEFNCATWQEDLFDATLGFPGEGPLDDLLEAFQHIRRRLETAPAHPSSATGETGASGVPSSAHGDTGASGGISSATGETGASGVISSATGETGASGVVSSVKKMIDNCQGMAASTPAPSTPEPLRLARQRIADMIAQVDEDLKSMFLTPPGSPIVEWNRPELDIAPVTPCLSLSRASTPTLMEDADEPLQNADEPLQNVACPGCSQPLTVCETTVGMTCIMCLTPPTPRGSIYRCDACNALICGQCSLGLEVHQPMDNLTQPVADTLPIVDW